MKLKELASSKRDLLYITPDKLTVENGFNVRADYGNLEELARDISENGVRVPLEIRLQDEQALLVDGHRRHAACTLAIEKGWSPPDMAIPCQVEARGTSQEDRLLSQFIRNTGKPLTPFEERELFHRLIQMGKNPSDIAKKIGRSVTYVSGRLDLGGATKEVREAVEGGAIAVSTAVTLSKETPDTQRAALNTKEPGQRLNGKAAKDAIGKAAGVRGIKEIRAKIEQHAEKDDDYSRGYRNALKWVMHGK